MHIDSCLLTLQMVVFSAIQKKQLVKREYSSKGHLRCKFVPRKQGAKVGPKTTEFIFYERRNGRELMHSTGREKAVESGNY